MPDIVEVYAGEVVVENTLIQTVDVGYISVVGGGEGGQGPRGYSAYEIAVQEGFVATRDQWLDSLEGPQGVPGTPGAPGATGATGATGAAGAAGAAGAEGPKGDTGSQGPAGQGVAAGGFSGQVLTKASATNYDTYWATPSGGGEGITLPDGSADGDVLAWDEGTSQWLPATPPIGPEGPPGEPGEDGENGAPGAAGADGSSAYDIAVAHGFVGTETAWVASLKGDQGVQGLPGETGEQGIQGLEGLQGPKGDTGDQGIQGEPGEAGQDASAKPLAWTMQDELTVEVGSGQLYNDSGLAWTIISVRASVGTASTGSAVVVDVKLNSTSIFGGNPKPTIAAGSITSGKLTALATTIVADGDRLTVDVTQVGSTTPGKDLTVTVTVL
ncbi:collagen-like protein [Acrocarpospora sp. B8E8]|uniref:collagen-like protein n=1 Tax=Acrocarpospora sp. B8E8 TaxID=3153572 RepID=UPI00325E1E8C